MCTVSVWFSDVFYKQSGSIEVGLQGFIRWTRWSVPTSTTPPAVYHIHGSAAGAFPGVAAVASPDGKLKAQGLVEAEVATTDEILDAFDGKPDCSFLHTLSLFACSGSKS